VWTSAREKAIKEGKNEKKNLLTSDKKGMTKGIQRKREPTAN